MVYKPLKNKQEIQYEVERCVHLDRFVLADKVKIGIPLPTELMELDENGCNWSMSFFRNARGHLNAVRLALSKTKESWNLGS